MTNRTADSEVHIEAGILRRLPALLSERGLTRLRLVTDENVAEPWAVPLHGRLEAAGLQADMLVLPPGEAHKTLDTCRLVYSFLSRTRADRHTALLAVGGGVIGDMAGFVAATWMRGMPLIQVPTSLLAQVDSSIGSKVAVDLPEGKNLVGAFYAARAVVTDPEVLSTLPPREVSTGMAEVIKAGIIASPPLFQACLTAPPADLVGDAVRIKVAIVGRDPFEQGERMQLNLGHTLGHALESATAYQRLTHGEAVAIGMLAAVRVAERLNLLQEPMEAALEHVLRRWALPVRVPFDIAWETVQPAFFLDKKRAGARTRYIVPERVGQVRVLDDVDLGLLQQVYHSLQEDAP